jgi:hypothetical protein
LVNLKRVWVGGRDVRATADRTVTTATATTDTTATDTTTVPAGLLQTVHKSQFIYIKQCESLSD